MASKSTFFFVLCLGALFVAATIFLLHNKLTRSNERNSDEYIAHQQQNSIKPATAKPQPQPPPTPQTYRTPFGPFNPALPSCIPTPEEQRAQGHTPLKIGVLVYITSNSIPVYEPFLANHRCYCALHGYSYIMETVPLQKWENVEETDSALFNSLAIWGSSFAIKKYLPYYDYLLVTGADTLFVEPMVSIEQLYDLRGYGKDFEIHVPDPPRNGWGLNIGIQLLKNTKSNRDFVDEWWQRRTEARWLMEDNSLHNEILLKMLSQEYAERMGNKSLVYDGSCEHHAHLPFPNYAHVENPALTQEFLNRAGNWSMCFFDHLDKYVGLYDARHSKKVRFQSPERERYASNCMNSPGMRCWHVHAPGVNKQFILKRLMQHNDPPLAPDSLRDTCEPLKYLRYMHNKSELPCNPPKELLGKATKETNKEAV